MTKDGLVKEAEKYVKQNYCEMCVMADDCESGCIDCFTVQAYIASAEPREKHIEELEKENAGLKDKLKNLESVAKVRLANWQKYEEENKELKEQIEKIKCCQNCKFEDNDCIEEPCSACTRCLGDIKRKGNSDKWEIK